MPEENACDQARLVCESALYAKFPLYLVICSDGDIIEPMRTQSVKKEDSGVSVFSDELLAIEALASWSRVNAKVQRFDTPHEFRAMLWIINRFVDLKWIALDPRADSPSAGQWMEIETVLTSKEPKSACGDNH